ncbi:MAG: hypothetical protein KJO36_04285 [Acidimicrobiia bacterium]|nr:hypothetical protein [Acidimicrobiia bacterium]
MTACPETALINVGSEIGVRRAHMYLGGSNDIRMAEFADGAAFALATAFELDLAETTEAIAHFAQAAFEAELDKHNGC